MKKFMKLAMPLIIIFGLLLPLVACGVNNDQGLVNEAINYVVLPQNVSGSLSKVEPSIADDEGRFSDIKITMLSSDTSVISNDGIITRALDDKEVALTVTLTLNGATAEKVYNYTVESSPAAVQSYLGELAGKIVMPVTISATATQVTPSVTGARKDVEITMTSSNPTVITNTGAINRNYKDEDVALVVYLSLNGETVSKTFDYVVAASSDLLPAHLLNALIMPSAISNSRESIIPTLRYEDGMYSRVGFELVSSDESVISNEGEITRGMDSQAVSLTVKISLDDITVSKTYDYIVPAGVEIVKAYLNEILDDMSFPAKASADLTLPTINETEYPDVEISFSSSNTTVISNAGVVTVPLVTDIKVAFTVNLARKGISSSKSFEIGVDGRAPVTDAEMVTVALRSVNLPAATIANITLPATGEYGTTITWVTNTAASLTAGGVATREANRDVRVTLTATVAKGTESSTKNIDVTVLRTSALATGVYARATRNNQMFYLSLEDGEVFLTYEGLAFVDPTATTRKIEFAASNTTGDDTPASTRTFQSGWAQNLKPANGMEFSFKINLSAIYKDVSVGSDWNKFFLRVTEGTTVTYLQDSATSQNGVSVAPTGGSGVSATWAASGANITLNRFDDKYGNFYVLKFNWGQIHFLKNLT